MNISVFSPSYVWDTRHSIIQATTFAIPLAIEAIHLGCKLHENPHYFQDCASGIKKEVSALFGRNGEENKEYLLRLAKNVARIALASFMIGGAAAAAFILSPATFAIGAALCAAQLTAYAWKGLDNLPGIIKERVAYFKDAFQGKEGDTEEIYKTRRREALFEIAKGVAILAATLSIAVGGWQVALLLSKAPNLWSLSDMLPNQTTLVVFMEYGLLGIGHSAMAAHSWVKGEKAAALFHLISAVSAVAFPVSYLYGGGEMRLHHSFIGLALQLVPLRPVQCLGSAITFDAFLNSYLGMQGIERGEPVIREAYTYVNQYDYENALLENLPFAVTSLAGCSIVAQGVDLLEEKPLEILESAKTS